MDSVTVTGGCTEGFFNVTDIHEDTTVFFHGRERISLLVSNLSFIWVGFCIVVYELKQASPLKSGILLLALESIKDVWCVENSCLSWC